MIIWKKKKMFQKLNNDYYTLKYTNHSDICEKGNAKNVPIMMPKHKENPEIKPIFSFTNPSLVYYLYIEYFFWTQYHITSCNESIQYSKNKCIYI